MADNLNIGIGTGGGMVIDRAITSGPVATGEAMPDQFSIFAAGLGLAVAPFGSGAWSGGYTSFGSIQMNGYGVPVGTFWNYDLMDRNPTVALCQAASDAPIRSAEMSFEGAPGAADQIGAAALADLVKEVTAEFSPHAAERLDICPRARDDGNHTAEIVWENRPGINGRPARTSVKKFKTLLRAGPWGAAGFPGVGSYASIIGTQFMTDKHGNVLGIENQGVEILDMRRVFRITHDDRGINPYGRSRKENYKKAWARAEQLYDLLESGLNILCRSVPYVQWPMGLRDGKGQSLDATAQQNALTFANALANGQTAIIPNPFAKHAEQLILKGLKSDDVNPYKLGFIDTKNDSGQGISILWDKLDRAICMGHLTPARAILEARTSSKADSETHGGVAVQIQEPFGGKICREMNKVVDTYLDQNHGPAYVGLVVCKISPMQDSQLGLQQDIIKSLFSGPQGPMMFLRCVDALSVMAKTGVKPNAQFDANAIAAEFLKQQQKDKEVNIGTPKGESLALSVEDDDAEKKTRRERDLIALLLLLFADQKAALKTNGALPDDADGTLAALLAASMRDEAAENVQSALAKYPAAPAALSNAAIDAANERITKIAGDVAKEVNASTLKHWEKKGGKVDGRWFNKVRAGKIAGDQIYVASVIGEVNGNKQLGLKGYWVCVHDEKTCLVCLGFEGREIDPMLGPWPTVDTHGGCRCDVEYR